MKATNSLDGLGILIVFVVSIIISVLVTTNFFFCSKLLLCNAATNNMFGCQMCVSYNVPAYKITK